METHALESYLRQMRDLISQRQENLLEDDSAIFRLIDENKALSADNTALEAFFEGEQNFYAGDYEKSLKLYLDAKEIPNFQFFCYRASSLISQERGQQDKALNYAQKAFKIDPQDPSLKNLYASLPLIDTSQDHQIVFKDVYLSEDSEANLNRILAQELSHASNSPDHPSKLSVGLSENVHPAGQAIYGSPTTTMDSHTVNHKGLSQESQEFSRIRAKEPDGALGLDGGNELETRIRFFQNTQIEKMQEYLSLSAQKPVLAGNLLCTLNGWSLGALAKPLLFTEESRKSNGGHYIRWNGKGIVINPGPNFLENFHCQGLSIGDIDFVIVTSSLREAYADVRAISELNQQLNKASAERQIIHYYLHQKVYQQLAPCLKPSFKQARNTIHKLEMFLDSPDVERLELNEGIVLHYFLNTVSDTTHSFRDSNDEQNLNNSNLGIRLELSDENKKVKIGYLSGLAWSPLLGHHLGYCDLLLAAFGNTCSTDYSRLGYNEDSLGYFGIATLLEELGPRLLLLTEFGGREGDIRLAVTKKMRSEYSQKRIAQKSTLLPSDVGLAIDLNSLQVKCLISDQLVPAGEINVVAGSDSFSRLRYLSSHFCA